ncbi:protein YigP [Methylophaga lonarensis MPL]|uniref:Ubiquinone biosynthesis accessory factor UbiJ n=1 Tax=Methylophaga lonarensis MPL TaxID=1286106 RepID=M7P1A0_9GAMM|nr:SCP2 sterol-binding domain-containing protein [Methylophaga lonarensis]EMR13232.1 protein YigP [Methylophaga lonarensis MPL]
MKPVWLLATESTLNRALLIDPESHQALSDFEGRIVRIEVSNLNLSLSARFASQQLQLEVAESEQADLTLTADSWALLELTRNPDTLFSPAVRLHGDVQFAKQLQDWMAGFDFDWEKQLASVIGDSLAFPVAEGIRQSFRWARQNHQHLQQDIAEYLKEEVRLLPDPSEINNFMQAVDRLRADLDRLDAKIARLEKQ